MDEDQNRDAENHLQLIDASLQADKSTNNNDTTKRSIDYNSEGICGNIVEL